MSESEREQELQSASQMLIAARERRGLSQKEVSEALFLTTDYIKYMDDGEFEKFKNAAFVKGYLRSYAKAVSLDGDSVVRRYEQAIDSVTNNVRIGRVTEETVGSVKFTGPVVQTGLVGLFGVVVVVGMVWWIASSSDNPEPVPVVVETQSPEENIEGDQETGGFEFIYEPAVQEEQQSELIGAAESTDIRLNEDNESAEALPSSITQPASQGISGSAPGDVYIERKNSGENNYITVDAGGFAEIEMTFVDDCWVEVEDGDGKSIYGDLNRSGDVLRIFGVAPFKLLFGRATSVALKYNGELVKLSEYTSPDETAKVTLGQP
ncbi:MAG: RodZ domain-containing protein [Pseudomonadales bacterium]